MSPCSQSSLAQAFRQPLTLPQAVSPRSLTSSHAGFAAAPGIHSPASTAGTVIPRGVVYLGAPGATRGQGRLRIADPALTCRIGVPDDIARVVAYLASDEARRV